MRKVVAISMPDEMHEHLRRSSSKQRYGSVSEYIRELIRNDQKRISADYTPPPSLEDPAHRKTLFDIRRANDFLQDARGIV